MSVVKKEVEKISEIKSIDTVVFDRIDENTIKKQYEWKKLYGELKERRIRNLARN